jgi:hypothetical protein
MMRVSEEFISVQAFGLGKSGIRRVQMEATTGVLLFMGFIVAIFALSVVLGSFFTAVPGSTPQDVMQLVLMTQYFDTLKEIAANDHTNTVLIPHTPNTLTDLFGQIRSAIVTGVELTKQPIISSPAAEAQK